MSEFNKKESGFRLVRALHPSFEGTVWTGLWVLILVPLTYYVMFRLPFRFPPGQRLMSASYAFGFNNGIAVIGLGLLLGLVTVVRLLWRTPSELPVTFPPEQAAGNCRATTITFTVACFLYAGLTLALFLYNNQSAPSLMWETRHFLHRTWLMNVYGLRPYTDFSAEYGPILIYTPLWTYWLLKPLGGSYEGAYFLCHFFLNVAGLWCADYVFSRATMPDRARAIGLGVIAVAGFAPYMGLNGVLIRYLCPFASLLLGHRAISRVWAKWPGVASWLATASIVSGLLAANVLLSPEVGVSFAIAWLSYVILAARRGYGVLVASLCAFLVTVLICWRFLPADYYGSLLRFSEGANNLPLLPAAHLVFYSVTMFMVVPPLLAAGVAKTNALDAPAAPLCGALGVLSLVMAAGALGRCDPPHVLFYGMGASILLMIRIANLSWRGFVAYIAGYAAVFVVLLQLINLRVFYGVLPKELLSSHVVTSLRRGFKAAASTGPTNPLALAELDKYPHLALPFATFGDPAIEKYVVLRGQLQPEYYMAIVGVYSPAALQRKLSDLAKADYLLVPERFLEEPKASPCQDYRVSLKRWFLYPVRLPCRAEPLDPGAVVSSFISQHYSVVAQAGHWAVLRRSGN